MKKMTKVQQEVVAMMRDGWELGVYTSYDVRCCWLQKGGCGKGGETKSVNHRTVVALQESGVIELSGKSFSTEKYRLRSITQANPRRETASG